MPEAHDHAHDNAHDHGHSHAHHGHSHGPSPDQDFGPAFVIAIALNSGLVAGQVVFGLLAGSVALIADAGHNLGDVLGLVLAWGASRLARRLPSARYTYGFRRSTILAALLNAAVLLISVGAIAVEGIRRLIEPEPVAGLTVMIVAAAGIVVNGGTAMLFASGRKGDINIRGAFLHLAADAMVSLGVVAAAGLVMLTGWARIDAVASLAIAGVILAGTWGMLRESLAMTLDAVPPAIEPADVRAYLAALPGATAVHDLHVWSMSTTETALTAHLVMPAGHPGDAFLAAAADGLRRKFRIGHATLQVEMAGEACALAPEHVV
jgi:cobalt-zinc-cadmium efflux system protein